MYLWLRDGKRQVPPAFSDVFHNLTQPNFSAYNRYPRKRCKSNVTVRIGPTAQFGHEVFSSFSALVASFSIDQQFEEISLKQNRSSAEDKILRGQCINYFFIRNSLRPFSDLLSMVFEFVTKNCKNHKDNFLSVLVSQLSEQEKMVYGIMNHDKIPHEIKSRLFIDTLQFEGIKNMAVKSEEIVARV